MNRKREYDAQWRKDHPNYDREWRIRNAEKVAASRKKWREANLERELAAKREREMRSYATRPIVRLKKSARGIAQHAARKGRIERQSCVICGNRRTEFHHMDYSKPLRVSSLCRKHHKLIHNKEDNKQ
jgi:hypothetical protein